ncbi:Isochorismatase family [Plasmodiophora brassicae]
MDDDHARRALVVIDMSVEQVVDDLYGRAPVIDNINRLVEATGAVFAASFDCRLWIGAPSETSLWAVYPGVGSAGSAGARLLPEIDPNGRLAFVAKRNYSCFFETDLDDRLGRAGIRDVYLAGINTDFCVFATALDAFYRRYTTRVVHDAVTSVLGRDAHRAGLARVQAHFGPRALVATADVLQLPSLQVHRRG